MEKVNYSQIYAKLTKGLSPKVKGIFDRRFGVKTDKPETLEAIGDRMNITRERVRQIEEAGFTYVRKNHKETLDKVYREFEAYFAARGGFKKEESVLENLGGKKNQPHVLFLLTIGEQFKRVCEKKDYFYFWSNLQDPENKVKGVLNSLVLDMEKTKALTSKNELVASFASKFNLSNEAVLSYLEVSKKIQSNNEGKLGLIDWPEIKPRGVRDKAFLVFKRNQKPLHFTRVAELIDGLEYNKPNKKTYPQTVHNELIKDARFVLVGRGTYALAEWGYVPGTIKDIIVKVMKEKQNPIHKDELVNAVLGQRLVAKNTILMNLNNKEYFQKNTEGKYFLKAQEA